MNYNATLRIRNFRSIKDLQIEGLGQFNLFVGENNCGKSSVLEAFYMAFAVPQLPLFAMNSGRWSNIQQNDDYVTLFHDFNLNEPVTVQFTDGDYSRTVSVTPQKQDRIPQVVMNGMPREQNHIGYYDITVDSNSLAKPYVIHYNKKNITSERLILSDEEFDFLSSDLSPRIVQFITAHWINYNVVEYVNNLVVNKQKDSLIAKLQLIDGRIKDIQIGNNNIIYADIGLAKLMPIHFIGLGVRKFISIASIVSSLKDGVLLIDEFENGLHYKTMEVLWNAVVSLCKERNIQLFATTHSYECIESFINATKDGLTYRIERTGNGHKAVQYTAEDVTESIRRRWELR